jgi:hypothetical protein
MNATTYKSRVRSPFQVNKPKPYQVPNVADSDTVRDEVKKLLGTFEFSATFEVDTQTVSTLKHIPGLIAFLCTIKKGDKVIGQGRGTTVINQVNRFIVRTINYAFNAALIDAVVRSTKILDVFRPDAIQHPWTEASHAPSNTYKVQGEEVSDVATPKQIDYLRQLIQVNVGEEDEREGMESQLSELTRAEASNMIKSFQR